MRPSTCLTPAGALFLSLLGLPCRGSHSSRMTTPRLRHMLGSRPSCMQSRMCSAASDLRVNMPMGSRTLQHGTRWAQSCQHLLTWTAQPELLLPAHSCLQAESSRPQAAQRLRRRHQRLQQPAQREKQTEHWLGRQLQEWTSKQAQAVLSRHARAAVPLKQVMRWTMIWCL